MKKYTLETTVGIFVLVGLVCVGYLTIKLGKLEVLGGNTYTLYASFTSVAGLKAGNSVDVAGVSVGKVAAITLDPSRYEAKVEMQIRQDYTFDDFTIASIKTSGLIGDKYISLSPGGGENQLKPGDTIVDTESALDIESLISKYAFGGVDEEGSDNFESVPPAGE